MTTLNRPPSFDYQSIPPYTVTHERSDVDWETWQYHQIDSAISMFYATFFNEVERRVLMDARGVTILGVALGKPTSPVMVATRESTDFMLRAVRGMPVDQQMSVLDVVDKIKMAGGVLD